MNLAEAAATAHVAEILQELKDDPEILPRLATCAGAAMSFCVEPETWPVFLKYFADSYPEEYAVKLRQLDRKLFGQSIQYILAANDPSGLIEVLTRGIKAEAEARHGEVARVATDFEVDDACP